MFVSKVVTDTQLRQYQKAMIGLSFLLKQNLCPHFYSKKYLSEIRQVQLSDGQSVTLRAGEEARLARSLTPACFAI